MDIKNVKILTMTRPDPVKQGKHNFAVYCADQPRDRSRWLAIIVDE